MTTAASVLQLRCPAQSNRAKSIRRAVGAFLDALDVASEARDDILSAIGEALINAVEHGSSGGSSDGVELFVRLDDDRLLYADVVDHGRFLDAARNEGRGFGLRVIEAIALRFSIESGDATRVQMVFTAPRAASKESFKRI